MEKNKKNIFVVGITFILIVIVIFAFFPPGSDTGPATTTTVKATTTTIKSATTTRTTVTTQPGSGCEGLSVNERNQCYQNKAVNERDITVCDNIELRIPRDLCRDSVNLRIAIDEKNPEKCGAITIKTLRDICYENTGGGTVRI